MLSSFSESEVALGLVLNWHGTKRQPAFSDDVVPVGNVPFDARANAQRELEDTRRANLELEHRHRVVQSALDNYQSLLDKFPTLALSGMTQPVSRATFKQANQAFVALETARREVINAMSAHRFQGDSVGFTLDFLQRWPERTETKDINQMRLQVAGDAHRHYRLHRPLFEQRHESLHRQAEGAFIQGREQLLKLAHSTQSGPLKDPQTLFVPLMGIDRHPRLMATDPTRFENIADQQRWIGTSIRSAVAGLTWEVKASSNALQACAVEFADDRRGCGEPVGLSVPLHDLLSTEGLDLHDLARVQGHVDVPQRISFGMFPLRPGMRAWDGLKEITEQANACVVRSNQVAGASQVRVRPAVWDEVAQGWRLDCPDGRPRQVVWCRPPRWKQLIDVSPKATRGGSFSALKVPVVKQIEPSTVLHDDYIVVFPQNSGIEPVYLAFKSRMAYPGVVSGQGQSVSAGWLTGNPTLNAVPVQVARLLSGHVFYRFSHLLAAFCKAVAGFPELCTSFSPADMAVLAQGQIPTGAGRFRIDFARNPLDGGDVYDLDNLLIVKSL